MNVRSARGAGTQSITRATQVLRELASHNRVGLRLSDVVAQTALEPPTARRILKGLIAEGMVVQNSATRRYFLGRLVYELGLAATPGANFRDLCRPSLERLASATGDTIFLNVRSGGDAVCIDRYEGSFPVKTLTVDIGARRPLGVGSGTLAILGALPDDEMRAVVATNGRRYGAYGGLDAPTMLRMALRCREVGYAFEKVIGMPGVKGLGVAVTSKSNVCFAALSIAAIESRMTPARHGEILKSLRAEARAISKLFAPIDESSAW
jgi:DNA-binding IclR family transcriptional regulator